MKLVDMDLLFTLTKGLTLTLNASNVGERAGISANWPDGLETCGGPDPHPIRKTRGSPSQNPASAKKRTHLSF